MRFACWITRAVDTYLVYVIRVAFQRQQWLGYTYIAHVPLYVFRDVMTIWRMHISRWVPKALNKLSRST